MIGGNFPTYLLVPVAITKFQTIVVHVFLSRNMKIKLTIVYRENENVPSNEEKEKTEDNEEEEIVEKDKSEKSEKDEEEVLDENGNLDLVSSLETGCQNFT